MKRSLFFFFYLLILGSVWVAGCSEENKAPQRDPGPQVQVLYPPHDEIRHWVVADSIRVYLAVRDVGTDGDLEDVRTISVFFTRPQSSANVQIPADSVMEAGLGARAVTLAEVPDSVRSYIPDLPGWKLYEKRWYTAMRQPPQYMDTPITSGTIVQLFAVATDRAGNEGVSSPATKVRILNLTDNPEKPDADFVFIGTGAATIEDRFIFDPSITTDRISPDSLISVRWDFNGDGIWDIDWDAGRTAADEIEVCPDGCEYRFPREGFYQTRLEAKNDYLPDSVAVKVRDVLVAPPGGTPRPPERDNYARIPSGLYSMGTRQYLLDGITYRADSLEFPAHDSLDYFYVKLNQRYYIEKTEVTNRLYLSYLRMALADPDIEEAVEFRGNRIWSKETGTLYMDLDRSKIFYDLDERVFRIRQGFEEHPVTGVSWFGATAYCVYFGLRLPTEAEWEVAARGGHPEYNFPIHPGGEDLPIATAAQRVNFSSGGQPATKPRRWYNGNNGTIATTSVFGLYDMAGNVAEWVYDWIAPYPYAEEQVEERANDPTGPTFGRFKGVRGGSYLMGRVGVRATSRSGAEPQDESFETIGFRTAFTDTLQN